MSRTIPRAYVTAAWSKNRVDAEDQARKYCSELVKAGYLPLCPVLAFSGIISEDDPDGEKKRREMSEDLLKRARFLVVCGKKINDDVREDISIAKQSKVIPTTLEGVLECGDWQVTTERRWLCAGRSRKQIGTACGKDHEINVRHIIPYTEGLRAAFEE